ncbi:MAG TPA: DUF1460 domain-containing protein [Gammaproteobacteria bacterium]|nr:DUF1460 domain-containing protein [Gammaproteobacteria bacterium]
MIIVLLILCCTFVEGLANPIDVYFKNASIHSMHQRTLLASGLFLGQPYKFDPLNDNESSHKLKIDQFDCLTYVQTVMALIHARNPSMLHKTALQARYLKSPYHYANRIHFASIDLNPTYEKLHWIKPLNTHKAPFTTTTTTISFKQFWTHKIAKLKKSKLINNKEIKQWKSSLKNRKNIQKSTQAYLPIHKIIINGKLNTSLFKSLEPIMLIEFVHQDWRPKNLGTALQVSHLGFLIRKKNRWFLRHASSNKFILDIDLETYLTHKKSKTFKGIALWNIR